MNDTEKQSPQPDNSQATGDSQQNAPAQQSNDAQQSQQNGQTSFAQTEGDAATRTTDEHEGEGTGARAGEYS